MQKSKKVEFTQMQKQKTAQTMSKNEILDETFTAQCKLELIKTVIETLINMVEDIEKVNTIDGAMNFACIHGTIDDFLHITHDGVYFAIQTLDGLQKGGAKE